MTPPSAKPQTNSPGLSGAIKKSEILPCTFAMRIDDDVLANAFCAMVIIIRPGARNCK